MKITAEALGPKGAHHLFEQGAEEVLIPCIGELDEAAAKASRVDGPVTLHTPANRIRDPDGTAECLHDYGITRVLVVSGNPGHGRGARDIYELIPFFRSHGLHVSVGAYPEDYFTRTSARHRWKSAGILVDKQAAGAQRIITQASFSAENLRKWLQCLRSRGVILPVQVGVMAQVPRKRLADVMKNARAEIFTHPRMQVANKPNLDLFFRMLRSNMPSPERFIQTVGEMREMGPEDGFHVYAYGTDISSLVRAVRAVDASVAQPVASSAGVE